MQVVATTPNTSKEMVMKWSMIEFINQIQYLKDLADVEAFNAAINARHR